MSERDDVVSEKARQAPGGARSPLQISARGWRATLQRTVREIVLSILVGAELNGELERQRAMTAAEDERL